MDENAGKIIVFHTGASVSEDIVVTLTNAGYNPQVDALHYNDKQWLKTNFEGIEHCFYNDDGFDMTSDVFTNEKVFPQLVVYFNKGVSVTPLEWKLIHTVLFNILEETAIILCPADQLVFDRLLPKPIVGETISESSKLFAEPYKLDVDPNTRDVNGNLFIGKPWVGNAYKVQPEEEYYDYHSLLFEDRDMKLYQIDTAADAPYTVVVRDYSQRGDRPMFASLYASNSWKTFKHAGSFLKNLWAHLEVDGIFDLDELLQEATEACFPAEGVVPKPEPIVYRKSVEELIEWFKDKENGHCLEGLDERDGKRSKK